MARPNAGKDATDCGEYWRCATVHIVRGAGSMKRLSVCLSVTSFERSSGGFAAELRTGRRCRSTAAGGQLLRRRSSKFMRAVSR